MQTLHPRDRLSGIASTVESFGSTFLQGNISGVNNCTPRKDSKNGSPEDSSGSFASLEEQQSQGGSPSSRRKKLQQFASRTKDATKRLLNTSDRQERLRNLPQEDDKSPNALTDDAAFNLNKLDTEHRSDKGIAKKIQVNVQSVAAGIVHPKKGIKGKATRSTAGRLSRIERPYLSKDMDLDLLDAHDNLSRVQSVSSSAGQSPRHDQDPWDHDQKGRVERLEGQRESLRAAYTTSRLVQRVRVVPKQHINFPRDEYFVKKNDQGQRTGYDWLKWIGYVSASVVDSLAKC